MCVYRFDLGLWLSRHLYCIRGLAEQTSGDSRIIDSIGNNSPKLLIQGFLVIGNRYTVKVLYRGVGQNGI